MLSGTISKSAVFMMHILNEITSLMSPLGPIAMIPDLIPVLDNPYERFRISYIPVQYHYDQIAYIIYLLYTVYWLDKYQIKIQILMKVLQNICLLLNLRLYMREIKTLFNC